VGIGNSDQAREKKRSGRQHLKGKERAES
jgi:hypothetical protein